MCGHLASPESVVALCGRVLRGSLEGESRPDPRRRHRSSASWWSLARTRPARGCGANNTAAQANLQTALSGAETYYAANDHSYVGVDGGPHLATGVSSIAELDIGLMFIPVDQSSPTPNVVSIYAHSGSALVITAYGRGRRPALAFSA